MEISRDIRYVAYGESRTLWRYNGEFFYMLYNSNRGYFSIQCSKLEAIEFWQLNCRLEDNEYKRQRYEFLFGEKIKEK